MSFEQERKERIDLNGQNGCLKASAHSFMKDSLAPKYSYNFSWLGRPIIQYPQDIIALQEIIWAVKPELVIETGIAHGGSLVFSASLLALLEISGLIKQGQVLGIDIDIREHNREAIEKHPFSNRIKMIQGSSTDETVVRQVWDFARSYKPVLLVLDSNHTHDHVLRELNSYAGLVTKGSYCVVFDTIIEDLPEEASSGRSWGKGNNPKTAVWEYLKGHSEFQIDTTIESKLLITVAPGGYLHRV
jgi:cephalosporin hydroxylase